MTTKQPKAIDHVPLEPVADEDAMLHFDAAMPASRILGFYRELMRKYLTVVKQSAELESQLQQALKNNQPWTTKEKLSAEAFGTQLKEIQNAMRALIVADDRHNKARELSRVQVAQMIERQHAFKGVRSTSLASLEGKTKLADLSGDGFRLISADELREELRGTPRGLWPTEVVVAMPVVAIPGYESAKDIESTLTAALDEHAEDARNLLGGYDAEALSIVYESFEVLWERQRDSGAFAYWEGSGTHIDLG